MQRDWDAVGFPLRNMFEGKRDKVVRNLPRATTSPKPCLSTQHECQRQYTGRTGQLPYMHMCNFCNFLNNRGIAWTMETPANSGRGELPCIEF